MDSVPKSKKDPSKILLGPFCVLKMFYNYPDFQDLIYKFPAC